MESNRESSGNVVRPCGWDYVNHEPSLCSPRSWPAVANHCIHCSRTWVCLHAIQFLGPKPASTEWRGGGPAAAAAALPTGQQPPLSTVWTPCGCSATASSHMSPPHDNRSQFGEKVRWRPSRTCFYMSVCFPMLKEAHQQRAYVLSSICEPCAAHRIAFLPEAPGRIVQ